MALVGLLLIAAVIVRVIFASLAEGKTLFNVLAWGGLWVIMGFRDFGFGSDTLVYVARYDHISLMGWNEFAQWLGRPETKDQTFYLLAKLFSALGIDERGWIFILSGIFCFSLGYAVHKYSPEPLLSFVAALSLGTVFFAMSGLRQTLAISILLWAYGALHRRRSVLFVVLVALAALFHTVAILALLALPLSRWSVGRKQWAVVGGGLFAAIFLQEQARFLVSELAWNDYLRTYASSESTLSLSGFLIMVCILAFATIFMKRVTAQDPQSIVFYNLTALGAATQALVMVVAEFFRVALLFSVAVVILIPMCVMWGVKKDLKGPVYLGLVLVLVGYLAWGGSFAGLTLSLP